MPPSPDDAHVFRLRAPVYARLLKLKGRLLLEGVPTLKKVDDSKGELTVSGILDMGLAALEALLDKRKRRK
jgi:hypothetical protein